MVSVTTATEPSTGVVHQLDGDITRCGQNASGWSRAITTAQLAGLVLRCEKCESPAELRPREFAALDEMIREEHPRVGDMRVCPCGCGDTQHYTGTEYGWANDARSTDGRA